jgi:anti-sigma factor RsiW
MTEALSCQELVELVTDYLEAALAPGERRSFEEHLAECGNCVEYLEQMRQTVSAVGTLTPETIDPQAEAALLRAFSDWKAG